MLNVQLLAEVLALQLQPLFRDLHQSATKGSAFVRSSSDHASEGLTVPVFAFDCKITGYLYRCLARHMEGSVGGRSCDVCCAVQRVLADDTNWRERYFYIQQTALYARLLETPYAHKSGGVQ